MSVRQIAFAFIRKTKGNQVRQQKKQLFYLVFFGLFLFYFQNSVRVT